MGHRDSIVIPLLLSTAIFSGAGFYSRITEEPEIRYVEKPIIQYVEQACEVEVVEPPQIHELTYLTGYGADCIGCIGTTYAGYDVTDGKIYYDEETDSTTSIYSDTTYHIVATDQNIFPMGTKFNLSYYTDQGQYITIRAIALDIGSAINGYHFDLLNLNEKTGNQFNTIVDRNKPITVEVIK